VTPQEDHGGLDLAAIKELLPHRYPFLLVDRVLECEPGSRLVGIKNVTAGESFFQGHFPEFPVMPGVLVVESLAQAGTVMMLQDASDRGIPFLAGLDKVRFRRPVVPGDQLRLELEVLQKRPGSCRLAGKAFVGEELAAQAEIFAVLKPAES
jgi:3-hydroxyacyl-[acyl-carrier-protein] dehydratase